MNVKKKNITSKKTKKQKIKYVVSDTNTGSIENQIFNLSNKINEITDHIKINKKDFNSKRSLYRIVAQKKKLLKYLQRTDKKRYESLGITLKNVDSPIIENNSIKNQ